MMKRNASSEKHVIAYEYKSGSKWIEGTIKLSAHVNLGSVLREMRRQDGLVRNVTLVSSAS